MNTLTTKEYQLLVNELANLLLDENVSLRDNLRRIESLLKHAVELLNESVFAAHGTIQTHQVMLDRAVQSEAESKFVESEKKLSPGDELLSTLRKALGITIQLNSILTKTTRSLQVEDIVSQIVSDVVTRSNQIDKVLNVFNKDTLDVALTSDSLKDMLKQIEWLRSTVKKSPIQQSSLDEGEIELF